MSDAKWSSCRLYPVCLPCAKLCGDCRRANEAPPVEELIEAETDQRSAGMKP